MRAVVCGPVAVALLSFMPTRASAELVHVTDFGTNPGALDMFVYAPPDLPERAPLVLVLHGCTQPISDLEKGGWEALADALGFYLVYPQQATANNQLTCFNWAGEYGDPANMERGEGENESLREMVDKMKADHSIDPARVYAVGFSAGAAMTAVLLATWPDVFAGGAIMSGVPYRCANSVQSAFDCQQMNLHPERQKTPEEWGTLVRSAYPGYDGPWPRVSVWHGQSDAVVSPVGGAELVEQWTDVHGIAAAPSSTSTVGGSERAVYEAGGVPVVESWSIAGMGHAVTVGAADPDHPCEAGLGSSYFQDKGVCAPYRALDFLGLTGGGPGPGPGGDGGVSGGDGGPGADSVGGMSCGCRTARGSARFPAAGALALLALAGRAPRRPRRRRG